MNFSPFPTGFEALFRWVWETSAQASFVMLMVCLVQALFAKWLPAYARYALWLLVAVRLLMPSAPASAWSLFNVPEWLTAKPSARAPIPPAEVGTVPRPAESVGARDQGETRSAGAEPSRDPPSQGLLTVLKGLWLLGALGYAVLITRQQRRFSALVRAGLPVESPRVLKALENARVVLRLRNSVPVVAVDALGTPAVFGLWRPRLLVPRSLLERLSALELEMVFLHELTHIRRRDVWQNWLLIALQILHWFNPLVWYAFRRLKAERELVCDSVILRLLGVEQRRAYGATLLKLAEEFVPARLLPGLVPVLNHHTELKRRITMIARFRPTAWLASVASAALLLALASLTLTRAAEKKAPQQVEATTKADAPGTLGVGDWLIVGFLDLPAAASHPEHKVRVAEDGTVSLPFNVTLVATGKTLVRLRGEIQKEYVPKYFVRLTVSCRKEEGGLPTPRLASPANAIAPPEDLMVADDRLLAAVKQEEYDLEKMRLKLGMPSYVAQGEGKNAGVEPELLRRLESMKLEAQVELNAIASLYNHLTNLTRLELRRAIQTASPDPQLATLLDQLASVEQRLADVPGAYAEEHPEVKKIRRVVDTINRQVEDRLDGIIAGLRAKLSAAQARLASLEKEFAELKQADLEKPSRYHEYFLRKRDLEALKATYDEIHRRLLQEQFGRGLLAPR